MSRTQAFRDLALTILACLALLWLSVGRNQAPQGALDEQVSPRGFEAAAGQDASGRQALPGAPEATGLPLGAYGRAESDPAGVPQATGEIGTALIGGWATYYDTCPDCAAAGPVLRDALGPGWRGELVEVVSDHGSVTLRLNDWCACGERRGKPTFIDVSVEAFNELSPYPARSDRDPGVIAVWIELDPPRSPDDDRMRLEDFELPATNTEPF